MEGTHRQLGTWLTDGLCGNDSDRLTNLYRLTGRHVRAVAFCTDTDVGTAGQDRTDLDLLERLAIFVHAFLHNTCSTLRCDHMVCFYDYFSIRCLDILAGETSCDTLLKALNLLFSVGELLYIHARDFSTMAAVHLTDDQILRYVYQTSGQITRVGGSQRGIGKSLTGASGRNEVFQNVKAFTVVSPDWHFDGRTHSGELTDLVLRTTRSGVRHHVDVVVLIEVVVQRGTNIFGSLVPDADELCLSLGIGNKAAVELLVQLCNLSVSVCEDLSLLRRNIRVADSNGDTGSGGVLIAHCLDLIEYLSGSSGSVILQAAVDDLTELALADLERYLIVELMLRIGSVNVAEILRNMFVEYDTSNGSGNELCDLGVAEILCNSYLDRSVNGDNAVLVSHESLVSVAEYLALALFAGLIKGQIVGTKYHILGRNGNRTSV